MIVRNLWLLVVLPTLVLLAITETYGWDRSNIHEEDAKTRKTKHELAGEKNFVEDLKRKSPIKVILWRSNSLHDRERIKVYERNEDGGRFKRNAIELDESKDSKKSYTKLKLAQTQNALKKWKNKDERPAKKRLSRRQANYYVTGTDRANAGRLKRRAATGNQRNDKSDYYAQRKAVMDRFYARQREIADKYANRPSTTPKYIYAYDLETKTTSNNATSSNSVKNTVEETNSVLKSTKKDLRNILTTTLGPVTETTLRKYQKQLQPVENSAEANNEEDASDDYEDYALNDSKPSSDTNSEDTANGVLNDGEWVIYDRRSDTLKWGNCVGKLVYQHNLILNMYNSTSFEVDLTASLEGPFCVTCIRTIPVNNNVTATLDVNVKDGTFNFAKLMLKDIRQQLLSYVIKIWAVDKRGDRCEKIVP